jgi:hypothetical protein
MRFVSAYGDTWLTTLSVTRKSNLAGVMLLWVCPTCGREVQGGLIRDLINLGEELERIESGESHRCAGARIGELQSLRRCVPTACYLLMAGETYANYSVKSYDLHRACTLL